MTMWWYLVDAACLKKRGTTSLTMTTCSAADAAGAAGAAGAAVPAVCSFVYLLL